MTTKKSIMIKVEERGADLASLNVKHNLKGKFCSKPFDSMTVHENGSVWFCCGFWLPYSIGNLNENTLEEIWNSDRANIIRESITDQTFKYCNHAVCGDISGDRLLDVLDSFDKKISPTNIDFNNDRSCNLSCPSCRTEKIYHHSGPAYQERKILNDKIISGVLSKEHNEEMFINLTGGGDPFGSKIYRDFLFTFDPTPWPNLKLDLQTNGVMLTPINWQKISKWHNKIRAIRISFDAATSETYNITRRGGDWDTLVKNCQHLNDQIKDYPNIYVLTQYVVQDLNYKEMVPYAEMILEKFPNFYSVEFQLVINWSTWDEETYKQRAIWKKEHPEHTEFLKVLENPIFKHKKISMTNVRNMYA
jgi:radical SAM protein with 4Fe4S-binding SPASM domain